MYKCSNCGYVGAAVVEFPDDALKKLQRAERMRNKFRQQRKRRSSRY
jgi:predicted nucleic acid-binding Zn ribbon protein